MGFYRGLLHRIQSCRQSHHGRNVQSLSCGHVNNCGLLYNRLVLSIVRITIPYADTYTAVIYIVCFVTFGLVVLSMCADLASSGRFCYASRG